VSDPKTDKDKTAEISRRAFLGTSAGAAAASLLGKTDTAKAQESATSGRPALAGQSAEAAERDVGNARPPAVVRAAQRPGSDLMVQVLRDLEIEYIAANPAASFEGLQESIINYGETPNVMPQFISALHEESSVDMAHGYAKSEGRPMAVLLHGTLGLMHSSMAIYDHNRLMTLRASSVQ
jgi:hypothetical protein